MPYIGKKPENIIATAVDTTTGDFSGVVTANAGIKVDNITIDGSEIDFSSGSFTVDVNENITFDSDTGIIRLADGGTNFGQIDKSGNNLRIISSITDGDIVFRGDDGGSGIDALTLDMSAAGAASFNGAVTANAGVVVDNITIDGTEIDLSSGSLTVDVASDITLDAGGGNVALKDDGTAYMTFTNVNGSNTSLTSNLGGDFILDVAGNITLDADGGNVFIADGGTNHGQFICSSGLFIIQNASQDNDIEFRGDDGGSSITALKLDMSDKGTAIFNDRVAVANGTNALPSLTFANDTNTGLYRPNPDNLGFAIGGVARAFMSATQFSMSGNGVFSGSISKGSGSFKIDHPLEAKKDTHYLVHSFVEAPQADNIYRGKVNLVDGSATVNLDTVSGMTEGTFILLNTNTQCFISNETGWTAVKGSVSNNILTITAQVSCTDSISWLVVGERHDQHMIDTEWTDDNGKVIVEPTKT